MHAECSASCRHFNLTILPGSGLANSAGYCGTQRTRRSRDKTAIMVYTLIAPIGSHPPPSGATMSSRSRSAQVSSLHHISISRATESHVAQTHSSRRSRSSKRRRLTVLRLHRLSMARLTRPPSSRHQTRVTLLRTQYCLWKTMRSI